jgi:hypothetical protein
MCTVMKKIILSLIAVLSSTCLFADVSTSREYNPNEKLPESSYRITKADTDDTFKVMAVPLYIQMTGKKFFSVGAGGLVEYNPFERVGFTVNGMKSYYSGSWDSDYGFSSKESYYELEAGMKFNLSINNDPSSPVQVGLGSRYTGYNQVTNYYLICNAPVKKIWALRAGYMRNASQYSYKNDLNNTSFKVKSVLDSVYTGIEWDHIFNVEIEVNDANIERDFGKRFKQEQNSKFYADAIIAVNDGSGDDKKNRPVGFRAGFTSLGGHWGVGTRLEGGLNPIFGGYFLFELGICY